MAIAAPPQSTAISTGSKEAQISLAPVALAATPDKPKKKHQKMFPPTPLKGEVFNPQVFRVLQDLEGISLLSADPETLTENERSRFGELKVAKVALQTLGDALSEVEVVGWRGNNLDRKRDIKLTFKDGRQREIEVKYGIAHDGQELLRPRIAAPRPEPRASATGHDDDDGWTSAIRF